MNLPQRLAACARAYRCGRRMAAAEQLVMVLDALRAVVVLEQEPRRRASFSGVMATLTAAQARGDVLTIADALEYELAPLLGAELPEPPSDDEDGSETAARSAPKT
ncbi:MAG: hypothetical protein AAGN82_26695 [Myxococcota bacterium]